MANNASKTPGNVPGSWYVDTSCIGCGLCNGTAPDIFMMAEDGSVAFVTKQPADGPEAESAAQALSECPVGAIGDDA